MDRGKELGPPLIIKMKVNLMDWLNLRNLDEKLWSVPNPLNGKYFEPVMANSIRIRDRVFFGPVTGSVPVIPVLGVPFFMVSLGN